MHDHERQLISSGAPWETTVGYSRAVRAAGMVFVSGTVGRGADGSIPSGPYAQTRRALEIVRAALREAGCDLEHVVRTRMYVTDIGDQEEVGRAHGEYFATIRPATSMVQVAALIAPEYLVEIEADAVAPSE